MLIKKSIIKLRTRNALKKNKINRESPSFAAANRIGIIFTWEGERKKEIVERFKYELELAGKKTKVIAFFQGNANKTSSDMDFFTTKDFSIFGTIKSDTLRHFSKGKFDFLFHLDTLQNPYIEYILALSQAKCRVSRLDYTKKEFYDFMIKTVEEGGIEQLCKQILHYTKSLVTYA